MSFTARDVHGDGVTVVELTGEIDVDTAPRMRTALDAALKTGVPIVIDMDGVTFMDTTGIAVLVSVNLRAMRIGTPVVLRGGARPDPQPPRPARPGGGAGDRARTADRPSSQWPNSVT